MKKIFFLIGVGVALLVGFAVMVVTGIFMLLAGGVQQQDDTSDSSHSVYYAKHWSTGDPYTHNLLTHRYGITADQLDGYLKSTGIPYDTKRINGQKLLEWENNSNLDVRAIIAIATAESSLGTAGVATQAGANMFGYGAFDSNPENASHFGDDKAIKDLTAITIILNKNESFKVQDDKAKAYASGSWNPFDGGVYFTDTSGTGKRRAEIMAKVDQWIDEHGGTPDAPNGSTAGGTIRVIDPFVGGVVPNTYGGGAHQCYAVTSYYAHSITSSITLVGGINASDIGSDYDWKKWGWTVENKPTYRQIKAGDIINFNKGANMGSWVTSPENGHTAVVSQVLGNNQFSVYEQGTIVCSLNTYTYHDNMVSSIIHPPK